MWYLMGYEKTDLCASHHGCRTARPPGGRTVGRCLRLTSLPDPARQCAEAACPRDCHPAGLRRSDRAQCDPYVQRVWPGHLAAWVLWTPSHPARRLRLQPARAAAHLAPPESTDLWQAHQPLDPAASGRRRLRRGDYWPPGQRRHDSPRLGRPQDALEAGHTLEHQSRPGIPSAKQQRDRLIRLASTHPDWALGCADAVWWSRLAQPARHAWASPDTALRLVEKARAPHDLDPKALAWYGLLVRALPTIPEQRWLRFAVGQPVSALTTQFLAWCCEHLAARGMRALLLVWDHASWHTSQRVRSWRRDHHRQVKPRGCGVRVLPCRLPSKSPWLNPIEPKGVHGKRAVMAPVRLLPAYELADRVCAYYGCPHEAHLSVSEKAA
jgi:hypothetical protein